jgi:hypothetical protein
MADQRNHKEWPNSQQTAKQPHQGMLYSIVKPTPSTAPCGR